MSEVKSRREVLAFIALADLPTPKVVRFRKPWTDGTPALTIELDTSPQMLSWVRLFTGDDDAQHEPGIPVAGAIAYTEYARWGGYRIMLTATDPVGTADPELDEATRGQLQQLVDQEVVTGPAAMAGGRSVLPAEIAELTGMPDEQAEWDGRENPVTGEPLPDGVDGFPAGGRS